MTTDAGQADGAAFAVSDAPEADEQITQDEYFNGDESGEEGTQDGQSDQPEDDEIEDDVDGVKVKGKKEAIEKLKAERLMQADYTRKTQAAAEERRLIEAQREIGEQLVEEKAVLHTVKKELEAYRNVNWEAAQEQDPENTQRHFMRYNQLKEAAQEAEKAIQNRTGQLQEAIYEREKKASQEFAQRLSAEIPNWNNDANIKITNYLRSEGWSDDDIIGLRDVRVVKLAAKALGITAPKTPPKTQPKPQAQPPAKVPSGVPSGSQAKQGLSDDLSPDEWRRRRELQLKRKR